MKPSRCGSATSALLALSLFGCDKPTPPPPAPKVVQVAPTPTPAPVAAVVVDAGAPPKPADAVAAMVDGARFQPLFPAADMDGATSRVERPAKAGMFEVVYKKGKDDLATLTITDTFAEPRVKDDYVGAKETAGGFPLKTSGYVKSAILVADRFQVQLSSPRLKPDQRKAWLEKVDLKGLAALK